MRKYIGLSTIALAAAMLAGGVHGQSLSIGGATVDLGGGSGGGAGVSVGGDSGVSVDVGGGSSGSNDSTVSVDLGGSSGGGSEVDLNVGGSGSGTNRTLLNLGVEDDNDAVVDADLFGNGSGEGGILGLDGADDSILGLDDDVNIDLFGDGQDDASVALDDNSAVNADILGDTGGLLGIDGLLGENGANDEAVLLDLFGTGEDAGIAGLAGDPTIDLSGSNSDPNDLTATLGTGEDATDLTVDVLGGQNGIVDTAGLTRGADATVDLSGGTDDPNDLSAKLNGDNGNPSDVIVDLFGDGDVTDLSGDTVAIDLSGGGDDPNDVTATVGNGSNPAAVTADLTGSGADNSGGGSADGGLPIGDILGGANPVGTPVLPGVGIDLGGAAETSTNAGTNPGTGGPATGGASSGASDVAANDGGAENSVGAGASSGGGSGSGVVTPSTGGVRVAPQSAVQFAAVNPEAPKNCFTPNQTQIDYLLHSRKYDASMSKSWSSADDVNLVPVRLCPEARVRVEQAVASDQGIQWMQDWVEKDKRINAKLDAAGLDGDHVLALQNKNDKLAVYVY